MTVKLTIAGKSFEPGSYQVSESISSLTAGDTSGAIPTFDVSIKAPDVDAPMREGNRLLAKYGVDFFVDEDVVLEDPLRGRISGKVRDSSRSDSDGAISFTCVSNLEKVNKFNVKAKPFRGYLDEAIRYYLSLAGITSGFTIHESFTTRWVNYIGWTGELWYHLKMLAMAQDFEIAVVNDVVQFRRTRNRYMVHGRNITRSSARSLGSLAKAVEVYNYNTSGVTNSLVYPIDGWDGSLEVLNVNAGEEAEYQLELSTSVSSIETPTMVENVGPDYKGGSVYTVVANDGLPIPPQQWHDHGGKVMISINDDTTTLTVKLWGPVGIYTTSGDLATNFSLALASDATANRYSTLRLRGTGVKFDKEAVRIRTGVDESRTDTEVGVTVDNPFLTDLDRVLRVGTAAARHYAGTVPSLSGDVVIHSPNDDPAIGNVAGLRVWDQKTRRRYRITSGSISPDRINFSAEDDWTFEDLNRLWAGKTFGQVNETVRGLNFRQADATGWDVA